MTDRHLALWETITLLRKKIIVSFVRTLNVSRFVSVGDALGQE